MRESFHYLPVPSAKFLPGPAGCFATFLHPARRRLPVFSDFVQTNRYI